MKVFKVWPIGVAAIVRATTAASFQDASFRRRLALAGVAPLALLWAIPASAQTATVFDLTCTGQIQHLKAITRLATEPIDSPQSWSDTFKVDLAHGKFCEGGCTTVESIYSITPTSIILREYANDGGDGLNRTNGAYLSQRYDDDHRVSIETMIAGKCTASAFTGLPAMAF